MGQIDGSVQPRRVRAASTKAGAGITAAAAFMALGMLAGAPAFAATGGTTVSTAAEVVAAFNGATAAGGTITLSQNISMTGTDNTSSSAALSLAYGKALTVDLNGHTLTVVGESAGDDAGMAGQDGIFDAGALTIKDGTLVATGGVGGAYPSQAGAFGNIGGNGVSVGAGTLTLDGVDLSATGGVGGVGGSALSGISAGGGQGGQGGVGLAVKAATGSAAVHMSGGSATLSGGAGGTGGTGGAGIVMPGIGVTPGIQGGAGGMGGSALLMVNDVTFAVADAPAPQVAGGAGGTGGQGGQGDPDGADGAAGASSTPVSSINGEVGGSTVPMQFDAAGCQVPAHTFAAFALTVGQAEQAMSTMLPGWPSAPTMAQKGWFTQSAGGQKADPAATADGQMFHAQCTLLLAVAPVAPVVTQAVCTTAGTTGVPTVTTPVTADVAYAFDKSDVVAGGTVAVTATPAKGYRLATAAGWTADAANGTAVYTVTLAKPHCAAASAAAAGPGTATGPAVNTGGTVATANGGSVPGGWLALGGLGVLAAAGTVLVRRRVHQK